MTHAQQNLLVGGLVGLAIGAAAAYFGTRPRGAYEDGIRVKNGSVVLEAVSGSGFDEDQGKIRSRKKTKGCYNVAVNRGQCNRDEFYAENGQTVRLTIRNDSDSSETTHVIADEDVTGGKKFSIAKGAWNLSQDKLLATLEGHSLVKIEAINGSTIILACAPAGSEKMQAYLAVCK